MNAKINEKTVASYSKLGAGNYEDPMNKNFLYGDITMQFIHRIQFEPTVETLLDMGCGTGFVFDELHAFLKERNMTCIGVDPAAGMLDLAHRKYEDDADFSFFEGSFEDISLDDRSADKIVTTLALHWVKDLRAAAEELHRVLKPGRSIDILMIARDDGAEFKKRIVEVQKKHLSFAQIMRTATLVQRVNEPEFVTAFEPFHESYDIDVELRRDVVFGSFDDHMKWWKARSTPVIAEVEDKEKFMEDLRDEFEIFNSPKGIPFDTAYLCVKITGK